MSKIQPLSALRISRSMACLGLISLLTLTGCSAIMVKFGWRVSLAKTPVTSIEASLPKDPGIAPGETSALVVEVTQPDGKVLATAGYAKGKVQWKDLNVAASVVSFKKGKLSLPHDPRISDGKTGHITVTVPSHPGIQTDLDIPLRYNYPFASKYSGSSGVSGLNGTDGLSGISGSMGSMDPNNPSPGGDGTNGGNGDDGKDGGNGGNGPDVQVLATLRAGTHPLLQISVSTGGRKVHYYLVDPNGGSLTVSTIGGAAGSGGRGGSGGQGGSGGMGTPSGSSGTNGSSGRNGSDGSPGVGGSIAVTYDPQVEPYLSSIHLYNPGGPTPDLEEEAVGPLW